MTTVNGELYEKSLLKGKKRITILSLAHHRNANYLLRFCGCLRGSAFAAREKGSNTALVWPIRELCGQELLRRQTFVISVSSMK